MKKINFLSKKWDNSKVLYTLLDFSFSYSTITWYLDFLPTTCRFFDFLRSLLQLSAVIKHSACGFCTKLRQIAYQIGLTSRFQTFDRYKASGEWYGAQMSAHFRRTFFIKYKFHEINHLCIAVERRDAELE